MSCSDINACFVITKPFVPVGSEWQVSQLPVRSSTPPATSSWKAASPSDAFELGGELS